MLLNRNSTVIRSAVLASVLLLLLLAQGCGSSDDAGADNPKSEGRRGELSPADSKLVQAEYTGDGPVALIEETVHDFGTVAEGQALTHNFIVKNTGNAPLTIIKAKGT